MPDACPIKSITRLSELIDVAIVDLIKAFHTPNYMIDLEEWHEPEDNEFCRVCLAGSVLARIKGYPYDEEVFPSDVGLSRQCDALDYFRMGNLKGAVKRFYDISASWDIEKCRWLYCWADGSPMSAEDFPEEQQEIMGEVDTMQRLEEVVETFKEYQQIVLAWESENQSKLPA